jgi:hypothetical protein
MKLTKATLKRLIKEEIATLKESRDDERFKSYRGIMGDMPRGRDRGYSPVEMVEEALYSLREYFDDFDGRQQPGNMQLERVEALLKELKEELSGGM